MTRMSFRLGDDVGRMLRSRGGRMRFFGLTIGWFGIGVIHYRQGRAPDASQNGWDFAARVVVIFSVVGIVALLLWIANVAATSRPAQEPTSYLGAGESLALAGTPQLDPVGELTSVVGIGRPGGVPTITIRGTASWYCGGGSPCTSGQSPSELIAAIDPTTGIEQDERVTVWHGDASVVVEIVDVCRCDGARIIDLSRVAFSRLADPSVGLIRVTLVPERTSQDAAPRVTLPPTDTAP